MAQCMGEYCDKVYAAAFPCHWIPKCGTSLLLSNSVHGTDPCQATVPLKWGTILSEDPCGTKPPVKHVGWVAKNVTIGSCVYGFLVRGVSGAPITECGVVGSTDCHCGCKFQVSVFIRCDDGNYVPVTSADMFLTDNVAAGTATSGPGAITGAWGGCGCEGSGPDTATFAFGNPYNGTNTCYSHCECCQQNAIQTWCYACHPLPKVLYLSGPTGSGFASTPMTWNPDLSIVFPPQSEGTPFQPCTIFDASFGGWLSDVVTDGGGHPQQLALRCCNRFGANPDQITDCDTGTNPARCGCGWLLDPVSGVGDFYEGSHSGFVNVSHLDCEPMLLTSDEGLSSDVWTVVE